MNEFPLISQSATNEEAPVVPSSSTNVTETTVLNQDTTTTVIAGDGYCNGVLIDANTVCPDETTTTIAMVATSRELPPTGDKVPLKLGLGALALIAGGALVRATRRRPAKS